MYWSYFLAKVNTYTYTHLHISTVKTNHMGGQAQWVVSSNPAKSPRFFIEQDTLNLHEQIELNNYCTLNIHTLNQLYYTYNFITKLRSYLEVPVVDPVMISHLLSSSSPGIPVTGKRCTGTGFQTINCCCPLLEDADQALNRSWDQAWNRSGDLTGDLDVGPNEDLT